MHSTGIRLDYGRANPTNQRGAMKLNFLSYQTQDMSLRPRQRRGSGKMGRMGAPTILEPPRSRASHTVTQAVRRRDHIALPPLITILMRCTHRPEQFKMASGSVLHQSYKRWRLVLSYDDDRCLEYLQPLASNPKVRIVRSIEVDRTQRCFYNLYMNPLIQSVSSGWIIVLDDDDMLTSSGSLLDVARHLSSPDVLVTWSHRRGKELVKGTWRDGLVVPGTTASCSYCVHSSRARRSRWTNGKGGGDAFFHGVLRQGRIKVDRLGLTLTRAVGDERVEGELEPTSKLRTIEASRRGDRRVAEVVTVHKRKGVKLPVLKKLRRWARSTLLQISASRGWVCRAGQMQGKPVFRSACMRILPALRAVQLPSVQQGSAKETILVETRELPHLEAIFRNIILRLPGWSHTVVCGSSNARFIRTMCAGIHPNIRVLELDMKELSPSSYSELLTRSTFWEMFEGEHILVHQEDAWIFHGEIDQFLVYDYVGAPWPIGQDDNSKGVGNGGFSLRSRSAMLRCLERQDPATLQLGASTRGYMQSANMTYIPEDVYFSKTMIDLGIGRVADRATALAFSQETEYSTNSLGGHNFWISGGRRIWQTLYASPRSYFPTATHRSGWKAAMEHLQRRGLIGADGSASSITLIDSVEHWFTWSQPPAAAKLHRPWIGVAHLIPSPSHKADLATVLDGGSFKQSLHRCVGMITLSQFAAEAMRKYVLPLKIPVHAIAHPTELTGFPKQSKGGIRALCWGGDVKVALLGRQDRYTSTICCLKTNLEKVWVAGKPNPGLPCAPELKERAIIEQLRQRGHAPELINSFQPPSVAPFMSNEAYDTFVLSHVIIVDLRSASANNGVLEMLVRGAPFFVNRLPAVVEYLGEDYPLFFETPTDIEAVISSPEIMHETFIRAREHMLRIDLRKYTHEKFASDVLKIANGIALS